MTARESDDHPAPASGAIRLEGRTALVTGASGGIGSAVAGRLGEAGALVVGADLPGRDCPAASRQVGCDLTDPGAVRSLVTGLDRLDVLVHCVGVRRDGVLWKLDDDAWNEVLATNLTSAFLLLREAAPLLRRAGGAVVLVSSINGERGKFGQANYAASKAGLIGLARTAARELGRFGVRVNVVSPGLIRTPMTATLGESFVRQAVQESALERIGEPDDVAAAILFLVTDLSRHVTGQVLRVDGGQLIG